MLKQLAGQTAIYGISSIASRMLNYLLTPIVTRMLTTAEYGVITDLYALIPFAMVVLTMGLETGYFRFAGKAESKQAKKTVFTTAWGAVSLMSGLFLLAALVWITPLARVMDYAQWPSYVWMVALIIALDAATAIPFARLREDKRAGMFVLIRTVSVVINVLLVLFFYLLLPGMAAGENSLWAQIYVPGFGPGYFLVANLITSVLTVGMLYPAWRGCGPRIRWRVLVPMLLYSLPLLASGVAGVANLFIDRQMIKYLMPEAGAMAALGIYGAVAKLGVILLLFVQMYRYAAEPFFLSNFKKNDFLRANAEALKYFVIASVAIYLMIMLFVDWFALFVGPDFREGLAILPLILLANIFTGMTLNLNFWYKQTGDTRFAFYITGTGLFFTLGLNIALIPLLGIVGAAWARLGCEAVMLVMSYYLNRKHYPTPYNLPRMGAYFLLGTLIYGASLYTDGLPAFGKNSLHLGLLLLFVLYALWREKLDVRAMVRSVLRRG